MEGWKIRGWFGGGGRGTSGGRGLGVGANSRGEWRKDGGKPSGEEVPVR